MRFSTATQFKICLVQLLLEQELNAMLEWRSG